MLRHRNDHGTRVLVIDPDREYGELISATLVREQYDVRVSTSIASALGQLRERSSQAVILDHAVEGRPSALDFANALRRVEPDMGLIFTSPSRLPVAEIVRCFEAGADEYVEKPFHPAELAARLGAVTRRIRNTSAPQTEHVAASEDLPSGCLTIDPEHQIAMYEGRRLELTETEFMLLHQLHAAVGSVVPYERLSGCVLGSDEPMHSLKEHVSSLRNKLRTAGASPKVLRTAPRIGYALAW